MSSWRNRIVGQGTKPADQFQAHPNNWRTHPQAQRDALRGALNEVGWVQQVIENARTGNLIDGHERVWSALKNDNAEVPFIQVDLDEAEEAYVLATLDPIGAMATTDAQNLDALLQEVQSGEAGVQAMLAGLAEDAGLYKEPKAAPEPQVDRAGELQEKWQTARGQIWQIGKHRLMCGDSTSAEDVERLMGGQSAQAAITDPPYDMPVAKVRQALSLVADRAIVLTGTKQAFAMVGDDWHYCLDLVWKHRKPNSFPTKWQPVFYHNNIILLARGEVKLGWSRPEPAFGSIIEIDSTEYEDSVMGHGKSQALFIEMLRGFDFQRWADPFTGTGSTLVACEQLDCQFFGMEIDPCFVAVCLERFVGMGLAPENTQG